MIWPTQLGPVASIQQLTHHGVTPEQLRHQLRAGRWQRPLPRVIVGYSGPIGQRDRWLAALAYGGRGAFLSHRSAGNLLGLRITEEHVDITLPPGRYRPGVDFVKAHQSSRAAERTVRLGLPCSAPARTVVDVACELRRPADVRALVSDAVQRDFTTVEALIRETERSPRHSPRLLREALEDVVAGARSAGEAEFLRLIRESGLPMPELNATVNTPLGSFRVDALWAEYGVAVEIDGASWHLNAPNWERDLQRQNKLLVSGLLILRFPVRRLRTDRAGVLAEIRTALHYRRNFLRISS
jgi:very-short-patch-repair endonuclease